MLKKKIDRNCMLSTIALLNPKSNAGKRLRRVIETMHPELDVEYHKSLPGFVDTAKRPENRRAVAILQIDKQKELDDLISVIEWLEDLRIILVLPDHRPDTISKGHLLHPRFVAFADGELSHVGSVLKKMVAFNQSSA